MIPHVLASSWTTMKLLALNGHALNGHAHFFYILLTLSRYPRLSKIERARAAM